jgi:hypothetical protein
MRSLTLAGLAAAATTDDLFGQRDQTAGAQLGQIITVAAVILAVGALLFLIVYLVKRKNTGGVAAAEASAEPRRHRHHGLFHGGRRRRKRLQEHRPRNPTLAETGGLPPLRAGEPPKPSA